MKPLQRIASLASNLFRGGRVERELDAEVRSYLHLLEEEKMSIGMNSDEARRSARMEMGGPEQLKEEVRAARSGAWLTALWQDVRFGTRMLRKNPGFTATAILTLALGIGANTAIFSVVHAVLLSSLPYRQPDRLVKIWGALTKEGIPRNPFSDPEWFELVDTNHSFEQAGAYYSGGGANLGSDEATPQRVTRGYATASLFPVLGVQPILGHVYSAEEDQPGHDQVVVLSYSLWQSYYGGDPNVLGKVMRLNARPFTVIGVLPEGFQFGGRPELWTPLGLDRNHPGSRGFHNWQVIALLKPGVGVAQASADMKLFARQLARENPNFYIPDKDGWDVLVFPLREELVGQIRPALLILMAAVGIVLLIACANIANLMLARSSAREKEMAIRASLGAGRWRAIRQLLTESVLLSLLGGAAGVSLGAWAMLAVKRLPAGTLPQIGKVGLEPAVLLYTFAIALATGVLFGLAPALHASNPQLHDALKVSARGSSGGPRGQQLRNALVVAEIAFSVVLVTAAGLMIRSFSQLLRVDPGFHAGHVLTMRLSLPAPTYPRGPAVPQFFNRVLERIRAIPGVQTAGAISQLPMGNGYFSGSVFVEDSTAQVLQHIPGFPYGYLEADQRFITPGYLETMKTPLITGRTFSNADTATLPTVAIVDAKFAADMWPGQNPLQKKIAINANFQAKPPTITWCTVVGVVAHIHDYSLDDEGRVETYFPNTQDPFDASRGMFLVARTASDPIAVANSVRQQVLAVDSREPVYQIQTMDDVVAATMEQPKLSLDLLGFFAIVAGALAAIGTYGVMAFTVNQRNHEIGIRMALGAQPRDIRGLVVGQGLRLALAGVALGLAAALYLARYMAPLIFGIGPRDPVTFVIVPALLMAVALMANWIPAERATRVSPIEALRHE